MRLKRTCECHQDGVRIALKSGLTRKHKVSTDGDYTFNIAPNQSRLALSVISGRKGGWLYLTRPLDLHCRCILSWAVRNRMKRDLAIRALKTAIAFRAASIL
jgi:putative transposase